MEANFGGECSLSVSLSLSLCVSRLSLSRSRVQREKQTNNSSSSNNNNNNNTKRERVTLKEFVFSDVCLFSSFSFEIPQKETRAALCISSSPFCLVSALLLLFLLLKKSAFLRRILLLCARALYPFIKSSGNICESSAQKAVRGFDYVADLSV
jgi:hypothetical protein